MSSFTPSPPQAAAIRELRDWFETRTDAQQVFRLFGYAGSGKSTVLKFALDELGLSPHRSAKDGPCVPGVVTATFTGKAALVLTRKGTPARTIHSLIYSVTEATEEEVEAAGKRLREAEDAARRLSGFERTTAEAAIEAMRQALSAMKHPRFALNPQSDAADARLIVLDEVSMVGEDMARDLMSFGKPILVLGDPGQLPPIRGEGAFTRDEPDVMLTEIHRQAAESAIIRLATMAREGRPIGFGVYDDHVAKLRKGDITPEQALRGGQLICGLNATRLQINNAMRAAAGLGGTWLPIDGMELSVDYFNFDFENVIIPQNPQAKLTADPTGPDIIRSPAGTVVQINTQYVNASSVETSGLDFSARYAIETENAGVFTPSFQGTYMLNYDLIDPLAGPVDGEGVRNFANFGTSAPRLRYNAGLNWENGAHSANVFVRHISDYLDDQNALAEIDSDTRVDIQYSLAINEYMNRDRLAAVTIGVRNLLDNTAPFVATNGGFDSKVHDPRGRLLYFGVDLEL